MLITRIKIPVNNVVEDAIKKLSIKDKTVDFVLDNIRLDTVDRTLVIDIAHKTLTQKDKVV